MTELEIPALKIYATTGIHPNSAADATPALLDEVARLSHDPRVLARSAKSAWTFITRRPSTRREAPLHPPDGNRARRRQAHRDSFPREKVRLARNAAPAARTLGGDRARRHLALRFSGTFDIARAALDMGFLISFAGPLTFPKAADLRDVASRLPLDRPADRNRRAVSRARPRIAESAMNRRLWPKSARL